VTILCIHATRRGTLEIVLRRDFITEHFGLLGKLQVARVLRYGVAAYLDRVGLRSTGLARSCRLVYLKTPPGASCERSYPCSKASSSSSTTLASEAKRCSVPSSPLWANDQTATTKEKCYLTVDATMRSLKRLRPSPSIVCVDDPLVLGPFGSEPTQNIDGVLGAGTGAQPHGAFVVEIEAEESLSNRRRECEAMPEASATLWPS
jgi:hypothetical protein